MSKEELKETFDHFDRDDNGQIDFDEFCELLAAMNSDIDELARRVGFDVIDTDGNGSIEFEEFCSWWMEQSSP